MNWRLEFSARGLKSFENLDKAMQQRIKDYLVTRVLPNPKRLGDGLTGDKKGFWRYRIGDYRVITKLVDEQLVVLVVQAGKRGDVYRVKI